MLVSFEELLHSYVDMVGPGTDVLVVKDDTNAATGCVSCAPAGGAAITIMAAAQGSGNTLDGYTETSATVGSLLCYQAGS